MSEVQAIVPPAWIPSRTPEMDRRDKLEAELQEKLADCPFCDHRPMLHLKKWPGSRDSITCQCGVSMAFDGKTVFYLIQQWNKRSAKKCA